MAKRISVSETTRLITAEELEKFPKETTVTSWHAAGDEVTEAIGVSGTLCVDPAATDRTAEKADAVTRMRESSLGLHGYSAAERVQARQVDGRSRISGPIS
jgi:hypothetical protein